MSGQNVVRVGVGVLLWRGPEVLLCLRKGSHGAGTWALPGGHLEMGESVVDCGAREVLEESGLVIRHAHVLEGYVLNHFPEGKSYVTLFVEGMVLREEEAKIMEPERCAEWRWYGLSSLPTPLFLPLQNAVKKFGWGQDGRRYG